MKEYVLTVAGLERKLPIVQISDTLEIASFVILGDVELAVQAAAELVTRIPQVDYLITAEAKGIPLVHELARILGMKRYFVARKSIKPYMTEPLVIEVYSITTQTKQLLCLSREESEQINGKRILIVDDVIST
ncbi:MAG: phosphoribosyltransferase family protein, partial [Bacillota bacterium]|nr:phosphoribosyltransferase family protein [Bacillota bacterium]